MVVEEPRLLGRRGSRVSRLGLPKVNWLAGYLDLLAALRMGVGTCAWG